VEKVVQRVEQAEEEYKVEPVIVKQFSTKEKVLFLIEVLVSLLLLFFIF